MRIVLFKFMTSEGCSDARTLSRRLAKMEAWLENPQLMEADKNAECLTTIKINMDEIKEPILCCPNDPDDATTCFYVSVLASGHFYSFHCSVVKTEMHRHVTCEHSRTPFSCSFLYVMIPALVYVLCVMISACMSDCERYVSDLIQNSECNVSMFSCYGSWFVR